ncbi:TPA: hypothetical protein EYP27_00975 [Candidatus Bathyarchaeota archaeon]|nr:hypothetical protein [Candidatus Bathyarchaeota archaeon]
MGRAVSYVVAVLLLVSISIVCAGMLYVWLSSPSSPMSAGTNIGRVEVQARLVEADGQLKLEGNIKNSGLKAVYMLRVRLADEPWQLVSQVTPSSPLEPGQQVAVSLTNLQGSYTPGMIYTFVVEATFSDNSTYAKAVQVKYEVLTLQYRARWIFTWYEVVNSNGDFGSVLGQTTLENLNYTFNWGGGEVYGGRSDQVGYEAVRFIEVSQPATITITITTDDGMEVYIDGQPVFNGQAWKLQGATTYTQTVNLDAGIHEFKAKWYEWGGAAYSSLQIQGLP